MSSLIYRHIVLLYAVMSSSYRAEHGVGLPKPVLVAPAPLFVQASPPMVTPNNDNEISAKDEVLAQQ